MALRLAKYAHTGAQPQKDFKELKLTELKARLDMPVHKEIELEVELEAEQIQEKNLKALEFSDQ